MSTAASDEGVAPAPESGTAAGAGVAAGLQHLRASTDQLISTIEGEYKKVEEAQQEAIAESEKARASGLEEVAAAKSELVAEKVVVEDAKNELDAERAAMVDRFIFKSETITLGMSCRFVAVLKLPESKTPTYTLQVCMARLSGSVC